MVLMPRDTLRPSRVRKQIEQIDLLGESDFRELEFNLVSHYRRCAEDQEWISVELTRKKKSVESSLAEQRLSEILAMLDHVHDPLIASLS